MDRTPTTSYLWISRLGGFVAIGCLIVAVVSATMDKVLMALPRTYVEISIAAFLFAIWAVLYELRDRGIKSR
jgi:hypothetical protein